MEAPSYCGVGSAYCVVGWVFVVVVGREWTEDCASRSPRVGGKCAGQEVACSSCGRRKKGLGRHWEEDRGCKETLGGRRKHETKITRSLKPKP